MRDTLNRRSFLLGAAPAAALTAAALSHSDIFAQAAPAKSLPPITSRTVYTASDAPPVSPEDHIATLTAALARHPGKEDSYLHGGAVTELEQKVAAMLGKEDCAFLPTGTLANNLAVRILCGDHKHLITQADSHLYADESDAPSILSGITMQPIAAGKAAPSLEEVTAAIQDAEHRAYPLKVGAISLESPVRRHDGESIPIASVEKICALAKSKGIGTHWDGARAFMLMGTPGYDIKATASHYDTVFVSLYKALHAPFGGMLAGPKAMIEQARDLRHICGGLIYHGWVAALPALDALDGLEERWIKSRAAAEQVIGKLKAGGYTVTRVPNESNIVYLKVPAAKATGLMDRLVKADVRARITADGAIPFFINETILRQPTDAIAAAFLG
jgi:threonine aldolase